MKKILFFSILFLASFAIQNAFSAKILFAFSVSTYSHRIAAWPYVEKLAELGHEVTFLSPFPPKKPNPKVKEVIPKAMADYMDKQLGDGSNIVDMRFKGNAYTLWFALPFFGVESCNLLFSDPESLQWMRNAEFDLVVIDGLFNECGNGLAYKFKAPYILFDTTAIFQWQYDLFGIPAETSSIPDLQMGYSQPMGFFTRVINTLRPLLWHMARTYYILPKMEEAMRKEMPEMPPLTELERNVSLIFTNIHPTLDYSRSLPSLVVPIPGIHYNKENMEKIPEDMAKFINEGKEGFVYISFGSAAQISKLSEEYQNEFFSALAHFKNIRFVWKWEGKRPSHMSDNVFLANWMPQQAILSHKNCKAFMTHGGLLGIEEAAYHGVPLIVFPIFAEQDYNAEKVDRIGYGIRMELSTVTQKGLIEAIDKIIYNKKYSEKMKQVSKLFTDRPRQPLEDAIWWTDYVLRNKDTSHLIPIGASQWWFQRRLLDVWLFIFTLLGGSLYLFYKGVTSICYKKGKNESAKKLKLKKK